MTMSILGKFRHTARLTTVAGGVGAVVALAAGTAFAANGIDVTGIGPTNVMVNYSCDPSAGVTALKVMAGAPDADHPSATGSQNRFTCDGAQHSAVVILQGTPMARGQRVQVRAALVDRNDTVVKGTAKVATLG
ncbi:hypothetical protein [Nocardia jiangxiensis]|uniref:Uncharacterized protein n=1 Tax=Nocardia jiangxiensis TaxID=282685 RepID=A0ABW6RST8_9NOCA|nr:hypothetical protein [Nocardia jiangxiensis]